MKQIELTSKLVLTIIGITSVGAILVPTYAVPTIRSADIFDDTIVSADLKDGAAVKSSDIVDGQVSTADLAKSAVTTDKIADGAVTSAKLASDIQGGIETHFVQDSIILEVGEQQGFTVNCPDGEQVTGGGYSAHPDWSVYINAPSEAASGIPVGWSVAARNDGNQAQQFSGYVICAQPAS
jgi:hypothetical protein